MKPLYNRFKTDDTLAILIPSRTSEWLLWSEVRSSVVDVDCPRSRLSRLTETVFGYGDYDLLHPNSYEFPEYKPCWGGEQPFNFDGVGRSLSKINFFGSDFRWQKNHLIFSLTEKRLLVSLKEISLLWKYVTKCSVPNKNSCALSKLNGLPFSNHWVASPLTREVS